MKISPVVSVKNSLMEIVLRVHLVVLHISSNISGYTGPIFAVFSLYESTLRADDGSVPYFPFCERTLPWQPNNVAVMKATDTTCILCTFAIWQHVFVSLLLARRRHCGAEWTMC